MSEKRMVPLPDNVILFNGGVRCDMALGPCACGATHEPMRLAPESAPDGGTATPTKGIER